MKQKPSSCGPVHGVVGHEQIITDVANKLRQVIGSNIGNVCMSQWQIDECWRSVDTLEAISIAHFGDITNMVTGV